MNIDLWTSILTVISFFLLYFLLNTFLFKPLLKFMDERKARIDAGLEEGKKAKQAKDENRRALDEDIKKTGGAAKELLANSKSADDDARSKELAAARDQASEAMKQGRAKVEEERKDAEASVEADMPEFVAVLAARLLGNETVVSANADIIKNCVSQAAK